MTGDGYALVLHGDADATKLGGTAICGFSSTGMVGVIAASHIIRALNMEQLGTVLDENFPAMAWSKNRYQASCSCLPRRRHWRVYL